MEQTKHTPATQYKGVDFSYPSSANAQRAGMSREGCYTVTIYTVKGEATKVKPVAHFATKDEAIAHAATIPEPWGMVWRRYMRHAIAKAEGCTPDEVYTRKATDPAHLQ